jgi:hypothetical protein
MKKQKSFKITLDYSEKGKGKVEVSPQNKTLLDNLKRPNLFSSEKIGATYRGDSLTDD